MSQRVLIVGVSESGKTTLANKLIAETVLPVFVRDPVQCAWTKNNGFFDTSDQLKKLLNGKPALVVVDEASDFFGTSQRDNHWIFSRGRHYGIIPIAIAQRIKMVVPAVREQATDLYVFESSLEASQLLAEAYNSPILLDAVELNQGEFFHVRRENGIRVVTLHSAW